MKIWIVCIALCLPVSSFAADIVISGFDGVSGEAIDTTNKKYDAFGTVVRDAGSGILTGDTSCFGADTFKACSRAGIDPTAQLVIKGTYNGTTTTASVLKLVTANNELVAQVGFGSSTVRFPVTWSQICARTTNGSANCDSTGSVQLKLGVAADSAGDLSDAVAITFYVRALTQGPTQNFGDPNCADVGGAYSFFKSINMRPGDGKAVVGNALACDSVLAGQFQTGSGSALVYTGIVVFPFVLRSATPGNTPDPTNTADMAATLSDMSQSLEPVEMSFSTGGQELDLSPDFVDGLQNQTTYCFIVAARDQAGGISMAYPYFNDAIHTNNLCTDPNEVSGLLDDKSCFIATAAYGSPLHPFLNVLRGFRNQFLLPWSGGRSAVKWYYKHSPPLAQFIANHSVLKSLTQILLWPAVGVAYLLLHWQVSLVVIAMAMAFALLLALALAPRFQKSAGRRQLINQGSETQMQDPADAGQKRRES